MKMYTSNCADDVYTHMSTNHRWAFVHETNAKAKCV